MDITTRKIESEGRSLKPASSIGIPKIEENLGYFVFNELPIGIFRSTPELPGRFVTANPAFIKMLGYEDLSALLKICPEDTYWQPEDRVMLANELLAKREINRMVIKLKKKNGVSFWGAITARVSLDSDGNPVFFDGAVEDITEQKENEMQLAEERHFSEGIIEALPGLFWLMDEEGYPVRWNKNVELVYGYSKEELSQGFHALKDAVVSDNVPTLLDAADNAFKGRPGYCEYEIQTKHGKKIPFAGDGRLVTINNKKYLIGVELDISKRIEAENKLKQALDEIKRLKEKTDAENIYLKDEISIEDSSDTLIGESESLNTTKKVAMKVAPTHSTVLIQGETGTGKGLLAKFIHSKSPRSKRPMIKMNCANLPETLIESILFGHEKGAFTNANTTKIGRFELADQSTIFLDEIAELPLELQSKLLRVIEDGEFERLGGSKTIQVDVRIIAATNRNLENEVKAGRFREDLLYRLNVYPITSPPLRDRIEDIPRLAQFFVDKLNKSLGKSINKIPSSVIQRFQLYKWPGNIRELQNVLERSMIDSDGSILSDSWLPKDMDTNEPSETTEHDVELMETVEYNHIVKILEKTEWVVQGEKGAAKRLGLNPSTLRSRIRKLGIRRSNAVTRF